MVRVIGAAATVMFVTIEWPSTSVAITENEFVAVIGRLLIQKSPALPIRPLTELVTPLLSGYSARICAVGSVRTPRMVKFVVPIFVPCGGQPIVIPGGFVFRV